MVREAPDDEFTCFLDERASRGFHLEAPNLRQVVVRLGASPTEAAGAGSARSPVDMLRLTRAVGREPLDVFFSPTVYTYFPLPPGLRSVVTIHDAIAERFPELTLPSRQARLFWRAKVRLALWQSRLVLTVSDYAARELAEVLRIRPDRIRVTSEAPADAYRAEPDLVAAAEAAVRVGIPAGEPWIIYVGGFNPHKHVDLLVEAHGALAAGRARPPHLLLVGTTSGDVFHGAVGAIREAIAVAGTERLVHWAGFVPDEELRHLHAGAVAAVLPSASEGFGLPAVEAAACGAPVVATTASPLPELLSEGGLFVAPGEVGALQRALTTLLDDAPLRTRLAGRARTQALELGWARSARLALAAIREAAA